MNAFQTIGLALSLSAMIANFYEKGGKKSKEPTEQEELENMTDETEGLITEEGQEDIEIGGEVELKSSPNFLENDDDIGITVSVDRITPVKK